MKLIRGLNHIAVMTEDLDRFIAFYAQVFEAETLFREDTPAFRHAILRAGEDAWLHPIEASGAAHGEAGPTMFERGHVDHIALTADSRAAFEVLRRRLLARGATDGAVEDLGAFHALWFTDPYGMRVEVALIVDPRLSRFHAPRRVEKRTDASEGTAL